MGHPQPFILIGVLRLALACARTSLRMTRLVGGGSGVRSDRGGCGLRGEALLDHGLNVGPECVVAFALHVTGGEDTVRPGGLRALDWVLPIIEQVIAEDLSFCGIGSDDLAPAVDDALRLIKVHRFGHIVGNHGIVLPELGYAIHLDG